MSIRTDIAQKVTIPVLSKRQFDWPTLLWWTALVVLLIAAIVMRLYQLGLPFDRDSYDEGVYWQSLRAMSAGHPLYFSTFYSQPPFFLLSTYPTFVLFGSSIWSARLGVALVSLLGLPGAFLLGKTLAGRWGALAALLLLVVNPLYLVQSQTLQAEASAVAFSFLAVGLAYYWWEHSTGRRGLLLAALTGMTVALSILCKLFSFAALLPIALLLCTRLWQTWRGRAPDKGSIYSILAGVAACLITFILVLLPFAGAWSQLISGVISFHDAAANLLANDPLMGRQHNLHTLRPALFSLLALAALYGIGVALLRRDWRVLPLLAWFIASFYLLWRQVPLFEHHLVMLVPSLISLAIMGLGGIGAPPQQPPVQPWRFARFTLTPLSLATLLAGLLILLTSAFNLQDDRVYYRSSLSVSTDALYRQEARIAADLRQALAPHQLVVTDAQFIAGLADRDTPPALVDTSGVRINSAYLTLAQLENATANPDVHAVLFFTGRFHLTRVASFHAWVSQHFHLLHDYGQGRELWVR